MLSINWSDVVSMVKSLMPQLITIGVVVLLALVLTIVVRKRKVRSRKFIRSQVWIVALIVSVVAVNAMLYGGFRNVLNLASGGGVLKERTIDSVSVLANNIADEGVVLLKNSGSSLPLTKVNKLNVYGWASTNPVYGGTGSGSLSDSYKLTSLLDGLHRADFKTNAKLSDFYTKYRTDRPKIGMFTDVDWTLPEPPADKYSKDLIAGARAFSDTSLVVIGRSGGEGFDLPQDVNREVKDTKAFSYHENSKKYSDFKDGQGILTLSRSERNMIKLATSNSDTVVVVYNGANALELGALQDNPEIDAIIWMPPPGQVGFEALGRVLRGDVSPSGRTPDTLVRDLHATPTAKNFGVFNYTNMGEYAEKSYFSGETNVPSFIHYVEGIYVGYRFWETAALEGMLDYDQSVVYPFGYGLSYTSFDQKMGDVSYRNGKISVEVTVTNTGSVPGQDVIQLYFTPPYTNGGIEKAAVNLAAFDKTKVLKPGASETVFLEFDDDAMASYSSEGAGSYVLESGEYGLSLRLDSHTVLDERTITVDDTTTYNSKNNTHAGDVVPAANAFESASGKEVTYLSRADGFANYANATAAPKSFKMSADLKKAFVANKNYRPADHNDKSDKMPTTGADRGLVLGDLVGASYDDPKWDELLDQMTFDEMDNLIANGGYQTMAVGSAGKVQALDVDGPAALNNNFTKVGSIGLPASVVVAATWNDDLAHEFGDAIGRMAREMRVAGWYAPAVNIHRSAFGGRNFEYFSEDPLLTGRLARGEIDAAADHGVYAFVKHFALNDQEDNRNNFLTTFAGEQSIREIYLRPFEESIKDGGAGAVMSSFNYVGTVYAGASPELLQTVLRDEWGFRGMVITDYFAGYGFQNADQIIRNGGDLMLATIDGTNHVTDKSATSVLAMRTATKNIMYTVAHSWIYDNGQPETERFAWQNIALVSTIVLGIIAAGLELLAVKRFIGRKDGVAAERTPTKG